MVIPGASKPSALSRAAIITFHCVRYVTDGNATAALCDGGTHGPAQPPSPLPHPLPPSTTSTCASSRPWVPWPPGLPLSESSHPLLFIFLVPGDPLGLSYEATPSGEPSGTSRGLSFSDPSTLPEPWVFCDSRAGRSASPLVSKVHSSVAAHSGASVNMLIAQRRGAASWPESPALLSPWARAQLEGADQGLSTGLCGSGTVACAALLAEAPST